MNDQASIFELENDRPLGPVVMIRQEDLEQEVDLRAGNIAEALTESMKSMKTDNAQKHFLREQIASILKQIGTIYQCTEVTVVETGSQAFVLFP